MQALYTFRGKVKSGAKRGRLLGFPTANTALHKEIPEGIYIALVKISGKTYPSATFIGNAKTFGEKEYKAESYILDFSQSIYGKWISVCLLKKIRENKKFSGEKELIKQMEKDIQIVQEYFT